MIPDHGLGLPPAHAESAVEADSAAKPLVPGDLSMSNRRPLLDLFPPPPKSAPVGPRPVPGAQPPPASSAGPASVREADATPVPLDFEVLTYETFYGLREKPFTLRSDSKFLYHGASHDRAAQELFASIVRRDGLSVLTGDAGTGKTMLCRALLDRLDRRTFTSFVADPFVTLQDLLKAILFDFGVISRTDIGGRRLAETTRQELTVALHEFLLSLVQINGFAVVFIDDAQTLSPDMLDQVQGIADTHQALMGIVLIGQAELLIKLDALKLASGADGMSVRARLGPLAEDEVAGYVLHRLTVGSAGRLRIGFNAAALALVYEISRGVPQLVNLLCDRALARGFEDSVTLIDAPLVASAARDLDLLAPGPATRWVMRNVWVVVALVALMLGIAAGAFVFRAQVKRAIAHWTASAPP